MNTPDRQRQIAAKIRQDSFAALLGAEIELIEPGYSRVSLTITPHMLNFHGSTHGGVIFSLGDIAFAAAGNSRGQTAVALNVDTSFLQATSAGDHLIAEAREQHIGGPIALYDITITHGETGAL
ncbi:MAG: PaaI family thioesterase, partial [Anaerolineae bacterium]